MTHLPEDAALRRCLAPGGLTRTELLLATTERRMAALWATVAVALGQEISDAQLTGPLDDEQQTTRPAEGKQSSGEPEVKSLREIALWMRSG